MKKYKLELIRPLMSRFIYLNNLRVRITSFYTAIVAGILALSKIIYQEEFNYIQKINSNENINIPIPYFLPSISAFILLIIGYLIFKFDINCRARASVVAQWIRKISLYEIEGEEYDLNYLNLSKIEKTGEDFYFSLIIMIINALLFFPFLHIFNLLGKPLIFWYASLIIAPLYLLYQIIEYLKWPNFSERIKDDPFPDLPLSNSKVKETYNQS